MLLWAQKMHKVKVSDDISMRIPANYGNMSPEDVSRKYAGSSTVFIALTDYQQAVDLSISHKPTRWGRNDFPVLQDLFRGAISEMSESVNFTKETIERIDDVPFMIFEFDAVTKGSEGLTSGTQKKYSYIAYTIYHGELLTYNFTCAQRLKNQYQQDAPTILSTLKLK
ncbi:hypothetical protein PEPS_03210 [Persicobacter psychrovividus]|uniref:Uncharacterized protein n=2 Tax=Persicobacter psychrovividus TaxID=387638 RepID=A0ABM7VAU8_9BACT|nr:hypothetical protein PEPS_03210 [Persicobacter psychrovividus]